MEANKGNHNSNNLEEKKTQFNYQSEFHNKRILITGASKGIGLDCCTLFKTYGAFVIGLASPESLECLETLKKTKILDEIVIVNLANASDIKEKLASLAAVDYLVNNAGTSILEPFLETSTENFDHVMNVNVRSVLVVSQLVAKKMIETNKSGSIVNVSSVASKVALKDHTSYCTSKGALDQLTKMMALELGPKKIRVNAINPTVVLTAMGKMAWSDPEKSGPVLKRIPIGRFAEERDCSNSIAFLLSSQASMINGITLDIEGGFLTN